MLPAKLGLVALTALVAGVTLVSGSVQKCQLTNGNYVSCVATAKYGIYKNPKTLLEYKCSLPAYPVAKGCTAYNLVLEPIPPQD